MQTKTIQTLPEVNYELQSISGQTEKLSFITIHARRELIRTIDLAQKNSLLKVRAEMLNMQGLKTFIQDCKVGDWTPGSGGSGRRKDR